MMQNRRENEGRRRGGTTRQQTKIVKGKIQKRSGLREKKAGWSCAAAVTSLLTPVLFLRMIRASVLCNAIARLQYDFDTHQHKALTISQLSIHSVYLARGLFIPPTEFPHV